MDKYADPLDKVVLELKRRQGELPAIARDCGLPYDTILRIKNRENDPGYSKVKILHDFLFRAPELATPTKEAADA